MNMELNTFYMLLNVSAVYCNNFLSLSVLYYKQNYYINT